VCGTLHREFAKLCIKAKCYQHSLPVVEHPVTSFKKNTHPMDILNYVYYKGLIFTALKRYQEAIDSFKVVLSFPTQCTHKIHIECYKKLILLSLIQHGKFPSLPKYTSQMLKYKLENAFTNYKNLANAFINKEDKLFQEIIDGNFEDFEKDKNLGLIRKLNKLYGRVRVTELSNTYLTLRYK
jgi:COP9 signalosome complex subunit 3